MAATVRWFPGDILGRPGGLAYVTLSIWPERTDACVGLQERIRVQLGGYTG
jgi:hypothetical protein